MKETLGNALSAEMQAKLNAMRQHLRLDDNKSPETTADEPLSSKKSPDQLKETKDKQQAHNPSSSKQTKNTVKGRGLTHKSNKFTAIRKNSSDHTAESPKKNKFNKQQLQEYFDRLNKSQEWLETQWPQLFNRENPKPLKRHIEYDILPHVPEDLPKLHVRQAIYAYVKRRAYLESILNDSWRYDLNGAQVEEIPEKQKEFTRQVLKEKQENVEKRQRIYEERRAYYNSKKQPAAETLVSPSTSLEQPLDVNSHQDHDALADDQHQSTQFCDVSASNESLITPEISDEI